MLFRAICMIMLGVIYLCGVDNGIVLAILFIIYGICDVIQYTLEER